MTKRKAKAPEDTDSDLDETPEFWKTYRNYDACVSFYIVDIELHNENLKLFDAFYSRDDDVWKVTFTDPVVKNDWTFYDRVGENDCVLMSTDSFLKLFELNAIALKDSQELYNNSRVQDHGRGYIEVWRRPCNWYNFIIACKCLPIRQHFEWSDNCSISVKEERISLMHKYVSLVSSIAKDTRKLQAAQAAKSGGTNVRKSLRLQNMKN